MPWTQDHYPAAMRNLDGEVRDKAIEIANALLRDGCEEGFAIRVAIAKARDWARLDGLPSSRRKGNTPH